MLAALIFAEPALAKKAWDCKASQIKQRKFNKWVKSKEALCVGSRPQEVISKNCLQAKCEALRKAKSGLWVLPERPNQNPNFEICNQLGGEYQKVSYSRGKKWIGTSRCVFADGSFANPSYIRKLGEAP